ncbi:MAG: hypothetical protein WC341_07745 [Bacteroidales bacterium]|jgi:hypothetical protein
MEIKKIDEQATRFTANGKEYFLQELTIGRLREFRKLSRHFAWGSSFEEQYKELQLALAKLNKQDWVGCAVILTHFAERIKYYEEQREEPALLLCTLFFNVEGENITEWNYELGKQKIEDWNLEGLDFKDFFTIAGNLVPGLISHLNATSLTILEGTKPPS